MILILLLGACSFEKGLGVEDTNKLTVLTVEYSSGAPLSELYVVLLNDDERIIDETMSDTDGKATFYNLQVNKTYKVQVGKYENFQTKSFITEKEFNFKPSNPNLLVQTYAADHNQGLAIPVHLQEPELPNGCEITALTAVLNYYGAKTDKLEMTQKYLPKKPFEYRGNQNYGPDPNIEYGGNPTELTGTYVFAEPIVKAANSFISEEKLDIQAKNISGSTIEEITEYVRQGIPVITWVTLDLSKPRIKGGWRITGSGEYHQMFQNLHTMVLVAVRNDTVEVMDPLKGIKNLDKSTFFKSYKESGEQAVIVY
ncbi:C39 family peptidase [Ureibacillus xyleni]|uniref:C39 family peptidase n=1 Tax=Ureibacillus xyleni TaxID=614648 RepID=UPI000BE42536|nr:C39 family peptidase [Ureibacillus xyleni]